MKAAGPLQGSAGMSRLAGLFLLSVTFLLVCGSAGAPAGERRLGAIYPLFGSQGPGGLRSWAGCEPRWRWPNSEAPGHWPTMSCPGLVKDVTSDRIREVFFGLAYVATRLGEALHTRVSIEGGLNLIGKHYRRAC